MKNAKKNGKQHIPPHDVVERFFCSSKATRGEDLQVEHPVWCGDSPAFDTPSQPLASQEAGQSHRGKYLSICFFIASFWQLVEAETTAAERFCGQKPRSMFAAILAAVEIPPAPLRPPQRAIG
jgi:hypothetical protein